MRDPSGSILLDTMKSSKSCMVLPSPSGSIKERRLKPNAQGSDKSRIRIKFTRTAFFLDQPLSIAKATIFSNTAIMVVTAAKDMNRKNRKPHNLPPDMALNTFGSVTNTRPGPLSAATLKEKQEGNIIRPCLLYTSRCV